MAGPAYRFNERTRVVPELIEKMVELVSSSSFAVVFQLFVLIVAAAIVFKGYKAYRVMGDLHLVGFTSGFLLFGISSVFVILNILFGLTPPLYNDTLWVHQTVQTTALGLIASSYYFKDRSPTFLRVTVTSLVQIGMMAVAIMLYFALPLNLAFATREVLDEYFYVLSLALVGYVIYATVSVFRVTWRISNVLVPSAFGILTIGQISRLFWAAGNAGLVQVQEGWVVSDGAESIGIYSLLLLLTFIILAIPLVTLWRHQGGASPREA